MVLRTSGTLALNAENGFLLSLMQPGQDFFKLVIIFRTPGLKILACMCERTWRTSLPCPSSAWLVEWRVGGGGGLLDECFDLSNFCTSCIIARRAVAKRDDSISKVSPGGVGSRCAEERIIGNTFNPEERVLDSGEYGPEELYDVVDCIVRVTPGTHKNASEAGDVSRGRLGDVIEAEAGLSTHRAVSGHPHLGGGAGVGYNKVVSHKMKLVFLPVVLRVDLHVVSVINLLLDVLVHLCRDLGLAGDPDVHLMDSLGGAVIVLSEVGEVGVVEVLDVNLVLEGGVVHDVLDTLLLDLLEKLASIGRGGKLFSGGYKH